MSMNIKTAIDPRKEKGKRYPRAIPEQEVEMWVEAGHGGFGKAMLRCCTSEFKELLQYTDAIALVQIS